MIVAQAIDIDPEAPGKAENSTNKPKSRAVTSQIPRSTPRPSPKTSPNLPNHLYKPRVRSLSRLSFLLPLIISQ